MEEQQKNEVLSKLYALRAGISTIALEKDRADKFIKNIEDKKQKLLSDKSLMQSKINNYNEELSSLNQEMKEKQDEIESIDNNIKHEKYRLEKPYVSKLKRRTWLYLFFSITFLAITIFIKRRYMYYSFQPYIFFSSLGLCIFFSIKSIIYFLKPQSINYEYEQEIKRLKEDKQKLIDYCSCKDNEIKAIKCKIDEVSKNVEQKQTEYQIEEENQSKDFDIVKHVESGNIIYAALKNEYNQIIDERDWGNLDYVIFAIETGRAETMKEALHLLDREKQADRIATAVKYASMTIGDKFVDGFSKFGLLAVKSCEVLSHKVDEVCQQMIIQREEQNELLSNMRGYISNLTNEISLENALRQKANETSAEIVSEVRAMKDNSNYVDTLLRRTEYKFN